MGFDTKELVKGLKIVSKAVEGRNTIPILGGTLVSGSGDTVKLESTDMDLRLEVKFPGKINFDQTVLMDPAKVADMLGRIGGASANLHLDPAGENEKMKWSANMRIVSDMLDMDVFPMPAKDFPALMQSNLTEEIWGAEVGNDFMSALAQVKGAISTEETRYYLNGVYFDTKGENWDYALVTTDGHRLSKKNIVIAGNQPRLPASQACIIPRKAIRIICDLFGDRKHEAPIRISFVKSKKVNEPDGKQSGGSSEYFRVTSKIGNHEITITTKLIDGTFPDYNRVVPKEDDCKLAWAFKITDLKRAMGAFANYKKGESSAVKLAMRGETTTLTAEWAGFGKMRMKLAHEGEVNFEIWFNSKYLLAALDSFAGCEKVMFKAADSVAPLLLRGDKDAEFTYILMPMRV